MVEKRAKDWEGPWTRDRGQNACGKLEECLQYLKLSDKMEVGEHGEPDKTCPRRVKNTCTLIKSNRGLSLDNIRCGDVKQLPWEAFEDLADAFDQVIVERKWPMLDAPIPIGLHLKPTGGDRPIAITPLLSALFLKSQGFITDLWEEGHMDFWEDAI